MSTISEAFLIRRAKAGDERATCALIERYTGLIVMLASELFAPGAELDDLVQEGRIGAMKAIRDFDPAREGAASFRNFLTLCVRRQAQTAVRVARRRKFQHLNDRVSIDAPMGPDELALSEVLPDHSPNAVERLSLRQDVNRLAHMATCELSDLEREVLAGHLNGRSYQNIADELGTHTKQVDNAIQRVRRKASLALAA